MSEKFDMKLVIDPVTTPLLHARLTAAGTARERAALLRSLAEAALRGTGQSVTYPASAAPEQFTSVASPTGIYAEPARSVQGARPAVVIEAANDEEIGKSHDVELIADEFAAFL
jgi:hypothetical protein